MGQYYKTVMIREGGETNKKDIITVDNDCNFPDFIGLKLMEHSYFNNPWTDSIAGFIYKNKVRMAHVGDYAYEYPQYQLAYNENVKTEPLDVSDMFDKDDKLIRYDYHGKYLINWDKKLYIYFDKYKEKSKASWSDDVYIFPITLLTALGNGRGGGDYYDENPNADLVGSWAWDCISMDDTAPGDFVEYPIYFTEK